MARTKIPGGYISNGAITSAHLHASHGITTSTIAEGTNEYFTDARVMTSMGSVSVHILPSANETYDLGSASLRWRDLFLSGDTINLGGTKLSKDSSGNLEIKDSSDNPKKIKVSEIEFNDGTNVRRLKISAGKIKSFDGSDGAVKLDLSSSTTSDIAEGTNLYFTNARADARITAADTGDLSEGSNLYFTNARARAAISATGSLSYNSSTGVMSFTMPAQNSDNITEGTSNLYFTNARADARIVNAGSANWNTAYTVANAALPKAGGTMTGNIAHASNFTIDAGGDIILDADGGDVILKDAGSAYGKLTNGSGSLHIVAQGADNDIKFYGNDGGSSVLALRLDMSAAGAATFNGAINSGNIVSSGDITLSGANDDLIFTDKSSSITFGSTGTNTTWSAPKIWRTSNNYIAVSDYSGVELGGYDGTAYGARLRIEGGGDVNIIQGGLEIGGQEVISSARNLTNIGTINSGTINSTGQSFLGNTTGIVGTSTDATGNVSYLGFYESDKTTRQGYIGYGSNGNTTLYITNDVANSEVIFRVGGATRGTITSAGNATFTGIVAATGGNSTNWNTAYTTANAALPKAGGTLTGNLIGTTANFTGNVLVGNSGTSTSFTVGGVYGKKYWTKAYVVSNTNIGELLNQDGTSLADGGAYRFTAHIDGTGTDNSSRAVFWNENGTWNVNVTGQSGTSSNHIQFLVSGGVPSVKTYHASNYTVRVWHERIRLNENAGTDNTEHYFGADAYLSKITDTLSLNSPTTVMGTLNINTGELDIAGLRALSKNSNWLYLNGGNEFTSGVYVGSTMQINGTTRFNGSINFSGANSFTGSNVANWNTAYTYSQVGHLPLAGGALTGAVTTNSTFDGRDVATDGTKLDTIETSATADQTQAEINALGITAINLNATDDRDVAPEDLNYTDDLRIYFAEKAGIEGNTIAADYQDLLVLNSYNDGSGGDANALAFDKSEKKIYHYQADQAATNWGTAKTLAYTDSNITGTAAGLTGTPNVSIGNITTTGYLRGPSTFTIDPATHGDDTGTLVIAGNLQVDGTTTTINSTTLTVDDKLVTLASGSANAGAANGAGIEVDITGATNPSLTYDGTNDEWNFNKDLDVGGELAATGNLSVGVGNSKEAFIQATNSGRVESNPAYSFRNDVDTGMFNPNTDNTIAFATGGTERLRIKSDGNVGIGTTSPTQSKLVVNGTISIPRSEGFQYLESISGGFRAGIFSTNTDATGVGYNSLRFFVNSDSTDPAMVIGGSTNNKNIGIGTTSPSNKLHVHHANAALGFDQAIRVSTNVNDYTAGRGGGILMQNADVNTAGVFGVRGGGWEGNLAFYTHTGTSGNTFGTTFTEKMRITDDGNVGIGTTAPQAKLQVEEYGVDTTTTSTTATTQVAIHTFAAATFRSARFTVQITNSTDSTYHLTEILMIHDGTTPSITEYGTIFTGSAEATFDADISSGNVRLLATPATTDSMAFKVVAHTITT